MSLLVNPTSDFTGSLSTQGQFSSEEEWVERAQNTTDIITKHGSETPYAWVFVKKPTRGLIVTEVQDVLKNAVVIGVDSQQERIYVARAFFRDGVYVGEINRSKSNATIIYQGKAVEVSQYEVLVKATTTKHLYDVSPLEYRLTDKYSRRLREMKTVVLLDDSDSMVGEPWKDVKHAVLDIAWMLRTYEGKGLDMHLLNDSGTTLLNEKDDQNLQNKFKGIHPEGETRISDRLEALSKTYLNPLTTASSPISIIIITDGALDTDGKNSLTTTIINLARSLEQKGLDRFHVGIQMVQIGNNARETETLKKLDDELATNHNVRDIVDTVLYQPHLAKDKQHDYLEMMTKVLMGAMFNSLDKDQRQVDVPVQKA